MDVGMEGGFTVHQKSIGKSHQDWIHSTHDSNWVTVRSTRFHTIFANDIVPEAQVVWGGYFTGRENLYHLDSIINLAKRHRAGFPVFPKDVDVITGGFPCQDFSVAGLRRGFNSHKSHTGNIRNEDEATAENRGLLYYWMREVIDIVRPKMFIAENVKGLISLGDAKDVIQRDFASTGGDGYVVLPPQVLNAAEYGVPQRRERVFFIGFRKSALRKDVLKIYESGNLPAAISPFPIKTHLFEPSDMGLSIMDWLLPNVTTGDIFSDLQEPDDEQKDCSQKAVSKAKWMGKHCQGQSEVKLDAVGPTIRSEHHGNIEFRRLALHNGGILLSELEKGLIERRLTVRECARIQTFPDNMRFVGKFSVGGEEKSVSGSVAYKLIGNAVPPLLAYSLARRIESIWERIFQD